MTTSPTDNPLGPFLGSLLPYLSQAGTHGSPFDFPMPGISHPAGPLASGDLSAGGGHGGGLGQLLEGLAASGVVPGACSCDEGGSSGGSAG